MSSYLRKRLDDIELRNEQMVERKAYEAEIDSLEEQLRFLESSYERLQATYKSTLEQSALKQVDLVVAKDINNLAQSMVQQKRALLNEEKRKLDGLHWQVWEEQRKMCDEVWTCVAENDSVNFLNDYPLVLERQKYAFCAAHEFDGDHKEAVRENPGIRQLVAEVAALEAEVRSAENNCLSRKLQEVVSEIEKLMGNDSAYENDYETQRLIEALEKSHSERMEIEAEISQIEHCKVGVFREEGTVSKTPISLEDSKNLLSVKHEPQYDSGKGGEHLKNEAQYIPAVNASKEENWFQQNTKQQSDLDDLDIVSVIKEQDKKLQAKKWYADYVRDLAVNDGKTDLGNSYAPLRQENALNFPAYADVSTVDNDSPNRNCVLPDSEKKKFQQPKELTKDKYPELHDPEMLSQSEHSVKSHFFEKKKENAPSELGLVPVSKTKKNSSPELSETKMEIGLLREITESERKFEPILVTPSIFFKSESETAFDKNSVQSRYSGTAPSTSTHGMRTATKKSKFVLKTPSKIGKTGYRQRILDDFHNFMLSGIKNPKSTTVKLEYDV
ncbi:uncharacterized protein LOC124184739 [Neodiprion fabricii]|uniref:uncharacterized protein LOC124184739 n=1 Tax=Neodiprion fabricii TaxID=2872261 RepID=UPI001ED8D209|nr:uncharacterized protein LOC124184739 [Neodiprion fabricii]XP_046430739.1 uncharacterized protein LOC124184739 [Neodiprion fabricii]